MSKVYKMFATWGNRYNMIVHDCGNGLFDIEHIVNTKHGEDVAGKSFNIPASQIDSRIEQELAIYKADNIRMGEVAIEKTNTVK